MKNYKLFVLFGLCCFYSLSTVAQQVSRELAQCVAICFFGENNVDTSSIVIQTIGDSNRRYMPFL